ncbi:MAG: phosphate signaling complex protein PhoU [Phycisphaerales bacterium]
MPHSARATFDQSIQQLKRRLVQEASAAVSMLEAALEALWRLDPEAAKAVRIRDDSIDSEEVAIESECFRLLTLQNPLARDFRLLAFILKVNSDVERVADHASGIAKVAGKLDKSLPFRWPTALKDMGQRVPAMCHALLRAVLEEDVKGAEAVAAEDDTIDALDKQLFREVEEMMRADPANVRNGLLLYRLGRELERVGDLMKNIAEDVIYLKTGSIVRHEAKRAQRQGNA